MNQALTRLIAEPIPRYVLYRTDHTQTLNDSLRRCFTRPAEQLVCAAKDFTVLTSRASYTGLIKLVAPLHNAGFVATGDAILDLNALCSPPTFAGQASLFLLTGTNFG